MRSIVLPQAARDHRPAARQRVQRHDQEHVAARVHRRVRAVPRRRAGLLGDVQARPSTSSASRSGTSCSRRSGASSRCRSSGKPRRQRPRRRRGLERNASSGSKQRGIERRSMTAAADADRQGQRAVDKYFGKHHVLRGVSLDVVKQEVVCIIGPSGSGKTDLPPLHQPPGADRRRPDRGERASDRLPAPKSDGTLVEDSERNIARQRTEIGFVFQRFNLWPHKTALENIIEAPIKVRKVAARRGGRCRQRHCSMRVGLADKRNAYPEQALRRPSNSASRSRARSRCGRR